MRGMREDIVEALKNIVGDDWVVNNPEAVKSYLEDETEPGVKVEPAPATDVVVVKPVNAQEVSEILKLANREGVPVYVRGGGTGLACGCVPSKPGVVISMERMKEIEIDKENLMAVVGAGVTLGELLKAAAKEGFFFPPHPGDEGAQIGGLIACNAVGARAVRTGPMRNYVLGLEVVLPTGEILRLGGRLVKDNTGAGKLMHLFIGTEGILGVITKAVLRLSPQYKATATMVVPFNDRRACLNTVPEILQSGIIPLGIEYVQKKEVELTAKRLGLEWPSKEGEYYLLIMLAEFNEDTLYAQLEEIASICRKNGSLEPLLAETPEEQTNILKIRSEIYPTLKPYMEDSPDITVPPANIGKLIEELEKLERKYDIYIPLFGHAADGNLHPVIPVKEGWTKEQYEKLRMEMYQIAVKLGGVTTGEHGVGEARKKYLKLNLSNEAIETLRKIKKVLETTPSH
ncbi:MAG: hypothetical protein B7O98_01535 [Zestosphaera tikiterensis]|uniref:FAD-binding PCMH-type domain-containing protein n=1 Tax=Zestosphaera tikiterensis TaxID=1973259 RepID=A0A2R7Y6J2_9CREN|nr:MAG: hypothetical protein B7O98_01535 [Zestosphaera tikiterensis]